MGALRLLAIPFRRILHDSEFAESLIHTKKNFSAIWGVVNEHATGAVILSWMYVFCIAVALIMFLMALSYVIFPLKVAKDWQKRKIATTKQGQRRFLWWLWGLGGAILLISADGIWSNITAYSGVQGFGDDALRTIDKLDHYMILVNEKAAEAQRFIWGIEGTLSQAALNGRDLRPLIRDVDAFLSEMISFLRYAESEARILPEWVTKKLASVRKEFQQISTDLGKLQAVSGSNDKHGNLEPRKVLDVNFGDLREGLRDAHELISTVEFYRFLAVFLVLALLITFVASGIQLFRLKKFRLVALCLALLCLALAMVETGAIVHLIFGTTLGAICDATKGVGQQKSIKLATIDGTNLNVSHIYNLATHCKAGQDIASAFLETFKEDEKLVTVTNYITVDGKRNEITLAVGPTMVTLPITNGKADYKDAIQKVIADYSQKNQSEIISFAQQAGQYINEGIDFLRNADEIAHIIPELNNLMVMIGGINVSDSPSLETFKSKALARLQSVIDLLTRLKDQANSIKEAAEDLSRVLSQAVSDPSEFIKLLQKELINQLGPFIVNVVQPTFNCTEPASALVDTVDSICLSGSAWQSLWLAFATLALLSTAIIVFLLISRKFTDEKHPKTISTTIAPATISQQYPMATIPDRQY